MIISDYKRKKECVLNIYERYKAARGDTNDGVNIEILQKRIDVLKQDKFTLAVVGQGKAGKSTFINALLRENVLPTGILQCTSAIIEIFKSDKKYVKVKYASGTEETVYNDASNEAYKHLQKIGSIPEKYRSISTVIEIINSYLIKGEIKESSDLTEELLKGLEEIGDCVLKGKENLIKQYIVEYKSLDKIPVEIQFGFPLKYEFDEMRLVDTPGVHAIGRIEDKTFNFINNVHAIIFVHQIEPIESKPFKEFYKRTTTKRMKEMFFLVLTHTGRYTDEQVTELVEEARNLYSDIDPKRIISVDSMLRLIEHDLQNGKTIKQIENESEEKAILIAYYLRKAKDDISKFLELIQRKSNFDLLEQTVDEFSDKAPDLGLLEIIESIKTGYENQINKCDTEVVTLKEKKESPQTFMKEIRRIQDFLKEYEEILHGFTDSLKSEYSGKDASWKKELENIKSNFPEKLTNCSTKEDVRREFEEVNDCMNTFIRQVEKEVTTKLSQKMTDLGKELKSKEHITPPTKIDLSSIAVMASKESLKKEDVYERRFTFKFWEWNSFFHKKEKTGEKEVLDEKLYLDNFKMKILNSFFDKCGVISLKIGEFIDEFCQIFDKQLSDSINEFNRDMEKWEKEDQSNDEIISRIGELENKKKELKDSLEKIKSIPEDLR